MNAKKLTLQEKINTLPRLRLGPLKLPAVPLRTFDEIRELPKETVFLVRYYNGRPVLQRGVIGFSLLCHTIGGIGGIDAAKEFDPQKALFEVLK